MPEGRASRVARPSLLIEGDSMKGKNKKRNNTVPVFRIIILLIVSALLAFEIWWLKQDRPSESPQLPTPTVAETAVPETEITTAPPASDEEPEEMQAMNLGYGLWLEDVGSYTGAYMEDGSNEVVSGVLMAQVVNTSEDALQYAKISVAYADKTYDFEVSDLPAGACAILLEKNRQEKPEGIPVSALSENVVFFENGMSAHEDIFEVSGMDGALNVRNISETDIAGDIYVHYKYRTQDIYYGGIAFRVKIEGGIKAGEVRQVMTGHYNPDNCEIVMIEYTA